MNVKKIVQDSFIEILDENNIDIDDFNNNTILLETGLDSLAFAILVAMLEEKLGYDPFVLMEEPFYPRTYGEFAGIYEEYKNHAK